LNRYPNQDNDCRIPLNKNFSHFSSKVSCVGIAHNAEQHCDFGSLLPPEKSHITPSLGTTGLMQEMKMP